MKRQLALALVSALVALAAFPAWASDGDILMVSQVIGTGGGHTGDECTFWKIQYNSSSPNGKSPWGTCTPPIIQVYAELKGASADGITGVEFALNYGPNVSPDPGYFFLANDVSGASQHEPFPNAAYFPPDPAPRGENLVWDACQTGVNGRIHLATLIVIPLTSCGNNGVPPEIRVTAGQKFEPSNPFFRGPLFTLCDSPVFTKVLLGDNLTMCRRNQPPFPNDATCSTSGSFVINDPSSPGVGQCKPGPGKGSVAAAIVDQTKTWGNVKALYR